MEIKQEKEDDFLEYQIVKEEYVIEKVLLPLIKDEPKSPEKPSESDRDPIATEVGEKDDACEAQENPPGNFKFTFYSKTFPVKKSHDRNIKKFVCLICKKSFKELKTLWNHLRKHPGGQSCLYCPNPKSFGKVSYMKSHMKEHHRGLPIGQQDDGSLVSCTICERTCENIEILKSHVATTHPAKSPAKTKPVKKLFKCYVCTRQSTTRIQYMRHMETHRSAHFECALCSKRFTTKFQIEMHMVVHMKVPVPKCSYCLTTFSNKLDLQRHMKDIDKMSSFNCCICWKTLTSVKFLERHIKVVHGINFHTFNKCETCGETFHTKRLLKEHERDHVNREKLFECAFCSKKFTTKFAVQNHIKYLNCNTCFTCGVIFSDISLLRQHKDLHHPRNRLQSDKEKPVKNTQKNVRRENEKSVKNVSVEKECFECYSCSLILKSRLAFERHIKAHKRNTCETCGISFCKWKSLQMHEQQHLRRYELFSNQDIENFNQKKVLQDYLRTQTTVPLNSSGSAVVVKVEKEDFNEEVME